MAATTTTESWAYRFIGENELRAQVKRVLRKLEEEHQSLSIELRMCEHDYHVATQEDADAPGLQRVTTAPAYIAALRRNRREGLAAEIRKREAEISILRREYSDLLGDPAPRAPDQAR